jgi:hypothetical protein
VFLPYLPSVSVTRLNYFLQVRGNEKPSHYLVLSDKCLSEYKCDENHSIISKEIKNNLIKQPSSIEAFSPPFFC